jgi:hypothetical protein
LTALTTYQSDSPGSGVTSGSVKALAVLSAWRTGVHAPAAAEHLEIR